MKTAKIHFFFLILSLLAISACDGDKHSDPFAKMDYWNNFNSLNFKNYQTFIECYKRVYSMNETAYQNWCDSLSNFESYEHFWLAINEEYETLETEADYIQFKENYKDYVTFSEETTDGLPDFSFVPNILNLSLMRLVDKDGVLLIGRKTYDTKIEEVIPGLKSTPDEPKCYKRDGKRKMWVRIGYNNILNNHLAYVHHKKRIIFGWVGYKTKYTVRHRLNNFTFSTGDISNGSCFTIINNTKKLNIEIDVWNRGVGEDDKCTFNWTHR